MSKITIIDGNSLLFRAYFATAYPGTEIMRNQEGIPTNAVFAFSNMINKILSNLKEGESIFVAFDTGKHTFRHEALETYKANRKPAPEDLVIQFPIARDFLKALNIYQFEEVGFEGDDIAGTVATIAANKNYDVTIYTSDKDFLQLVNDRITVNLIRKGLSDVVPMTREKVLEMFDFEPKQIIDYKGLRGDASDNLPGIPGVGEKTAIKLIKDYGSFDNILEHAEEINGKVGQNLVQYKDLGKLSRDLAIIQTDIELPFKVEDTLYSGYDFKEISSFCQKYGLKQFMNKMPQKWKQLNSEEFNIEFQTVNSLKDYSIPKDIGIAIDLQDDNYTQGDIFGIAFSFGDKNLYISFEDLVNDKTALNILKDTSYKKYCFDFKAIKVALAKNNIKIDGVYFDLLIASYLVDSSIKNDVDAIMNLYGVDLVKSEAELSLFVNSNPTRTTNIAYFSIKLYDKVLSELAKFDAEKLYRDLEVPLIDVLADMEIEGFPIDRDILEDFGKTYRIKCEQIAEEIYQIAGERFNLSSPKQIGDILFNKLQLKSNKKMSTSVDELKYLLDEHPIVGKILEFRKYNKLLTTYVEGIKNHIYEDGKIHAKFNQALTQTGRLSSSEPNLQNISIRDEESKQIRKSFHYPNNEFLILSLDYSQIELRVLACLSKCDALKNIFLSGEDIHKATAKKIFNLQGEPNDGQRRRAKTVNFGIVYGISDWGLADQLGISPKEAREIISSFYSSFPEVADFFKNVVDNAVNDGYVSTLFGRRRYLREIHDSNYQTREFAKRAAMNAPIQGTAADLIKLAMIQIHKALKLNNYKSKMVLQIHDELIFKVDKTEKDSIYKLVKECMENAISIDIPLVVDGGFGEDWYEAK